MVSGAPRGPASPSNWQRSSNTPPGSQRGSRHRLPCAPVKLMWCSCITTAFYTAEQVGDGLLTSDITWIKCRAPASPEPSRFTGVQASKGSFCAVRKGRLTVTEVYKLLYARSIIVAFVFFFTPVGPTFIAFTQIYNKDVRVIPQSYDVDEPSRRAVESLRPMTGIHHLSRHLLQMVLGLKKCATFSLWKLVCIIEIKLNILILSVKKNQPHTSPWNQQNCYFNGLTKKNAT